MSNLPHGYEGNCHISGFLRYWKSNLSRSDDQRTHCTCDWHRE